MHAVQNSQVKRFVQKWTCHKTTNKFKLNICKVEWSGVYNDDDRENACQEYDK